MLTVKFYKDHTSTILEAECVNIYPAGAMSGEKPGVRSNKVREVQVITSAPKAAIYYVGEPGATVEGYPDNEMPPLYDVAFIENSHGATTETVRPY